MGIPEKTPGQEGKQKKKGVKGLLKLVKGFKKPGPRLLQDRQGVLNKGEELDLFSFRKGLDGLRPLFFPGRVGKDRELFGDPPAPGFQTDLE